MRILHRLEQETSNRAASALHPSLFIIHYSLFAVRHANLRFSFLVLLLEEKIEQERGTMSDFQQHDCKCYRQSIVTKYCKLLRIDAVCERCARQD